MGWKEETVMTNKKNFVLLALEKTKPFSKLCKDFNISRECGYKWLKRYNQQGFKGLEERSKRPFTSPNRTSQSTENKILEIREEHPAWGGRKIHAHLSRMGVKNLPTPSTITRILHRHRRIEGTKSIKHKAFKRFEHALPNQLWQMDFKGHFSMKTGRCHPLTVLDDHSRYSLGLKACGDEQGETVKRSLIHIFRENGLPERMTMDNGSPWGARGGYTSLEVWLIRLGIYVSHSRPFHPQTQGKDERFHRSLKEELLDRKEFIDLKDTQKSFDKWRNCYNKERPHESLGMDSPISRYQKSKREYPEQLPYIDYDGAVEKRKVNNKGYIWYKGKTYFVSESMAELLVKIIETERDGIIKVYLNHQRVREIDLINKVSAKRII